MTQLLIKNIKEIITMDDQWRRLKNYDLLIEDGVITRIEPEITDLTPNRQIDGRHMWLFPGLINTHHHMYQTLTRNIAQVQDVELFAWLEYLYPIWSKLTPEAVYTSTLLAQAELLKTGCTTSSDHLYVFPRESARLVEEQVRAARKIGQRFHAARGSMSRSQKDGGLPPDSLVQTADQILDDCQQLIEKYHDPQPGSMMQIVLAPCSPFSVTTDLLKQTVILAREYGVHCHTHLCETLDEEEYCLEMHGLRPLAYMESLDWLGSDIWYAHGIHFNQQELKLLARTKTGIAHCPVSNMKLASGIARVPEMLELGIPVGLAVDGSASNDSSNLTLEMRAAFLLHRVTYGIKAMSAEKALFLATRGSAQLLGRDDLGSVEVGKMGDLFMINADRLGFAGGQGDPVSALVHCGDSQIVDYTIVNGQVVVEAGQLVTVDEQRLISEHNHLSQIMISSQ